MRLAVYNVLNGEVPEDWSFLALRMLTEGGNEPVIGFKLQPKLDERLMTRLSLIDRQTLERALWQSR